MIPALFAANRRGIFCDPAPLWAAPGGCSGNEHAERDASKTPGSSFKGFRRKMNPASFSPLGILISGRGSNLSAIIDAIADGRLDASIAVVISNRADAPGLARAREAGIETLVLDHRAYQSRADYDRALVAALRERGVGLVCLAGFMRLLGPDFVDAFPNAILNVHPSLLPAFPGTHAQRQALEHGVKIAGCTVHIVT